MDWVQFGVQWLHVITAITWFGAVIYNDFILIPSLMKLPVGEQRSAGGAIGSRAEYVLLRVAPAVIILGFLRGTVFGSIRSLDALTTTYGLTWLVSLVVASFTLYWGVKVIGGALVRFNAFDVSQATLADGSPNPTLVGLVDDLKRKSQIELLFFLVIFTCMILMRFGY
ncbi:MAG TPA: hypothetical protein VK194_02850 [Candidatus Deferrimicrobium sp.]|nr:hypothetical protein [Candidatus Deferrimicrobium sp.]